MSDTTTTECRNQGIACPERACGFCHEGYCKEEFKEKLKSLGFGKVPGGYKDNN